MPETIEGRELHTTPEIVRDTIPHLTFAVSDKEQDQDYKDILEKSAGSFQEVWQPVGEEVLASFIEVSNSEWGPLYKGKDLPVIFSATTHSGASMSDHLIRLGVRDKSPWAKKRGKYDEIRDTDSLIGSMVHELSHHFANSGDIQYIQEEYADRVKGTDDLDANKRNVLYNEVYAELIWKAVVEKHFPQEKITQWEERRREAYKGIYSLIDSLTPDEKKRVVDRAYRAKVHGDKEKTNSQSKISKIRQVLASFQKK